MATRKNNWLTIGDTLINIDQIVEVKRTFMGEIHMSLSGGINHVFTGQIAIELYKLFYEYINAKASMPRRDSKGHFIKNTIERFF